MFTQRPSADGKHTELVCNRCRTSEPFVPGDVRAITLAKRDHKCRDEVYRNQRAGGAA